MIVVVLLIVVMSVMGLSILQLLRLDLALVGNSRTNFRVRETVEGITYEMLGSQSLRQFFPQPNIEDPTSPLVWTGYDPSGSQFLVGGDLIVDGSFRAEVRFLREQSVSNSSVQKSVALVAEIDGFGTASPNVNSPAEATKNLVVDTAIVVGKPNRIGPKAAFR